MSESLAGLRRTMMCGEVGLPQVGADGLGAAPARPWRPDFY